MPSSPDWSKRSDNCLFEWRPSRWLAVWLVLMGVAAAFSLGVSALPVWLVRPGVLLVLGYGVWITRREASRPPVHLQVGGKGAIVDGEQVAGFRLYWRGPLVFARWQTAGKDVRRLVWWPDTLDSSMRRELRLAAPREPAARGRRSVAP